VTLLTDFIIAAAVIGLPLAAGAEEPVAGRLTQNAPHSNSCVPHNVATDQLSKVFNEKVVGLGLAKNQQSVVELYVSGEGSWTILVTLANGISCIAAAGENWMDAAKQAGLAS
jgi:hypothetical protein